MIAFTARENPKIEIIRRSLVRERAVAGKWSLVQRSPKSNLIGKEYLGTEGTDPHRHGNLGCVVVAVQNQVWTGIEVKLINHEDGVCGFVRDWLGGIDDDLALRHVNSAQ